MIVLPLSPSFFTVLFFFSSNSHTEDLSPFLHLKPYFLGKEAKKNDLSLQLIMRLCEAFISIVSVCSRTVYWGVMFSDVFTPATIL